MISNHELMTASLTNIEYWVRNGQLSDRDFNYIRKRLNELEAKNKAMKIMLRKQEKVMAATRHYGKAMLKRMGLTGWDVEVVPRRNEREE